MALPIHFLQRQLSKKVPSAQDWRDHQCRIGELYLAKNKTLKDVMHIMEKEHGFKATSANERTPSHNQSHSPLSRKSTASVEAQFCASKASTGSSDTSGKSAIFSSTWAATSADETWDPVSTNAQLPSSAKTNGKSLEFTPSAFRPVVLSCATSQAFQQLEREVIRFFRASFDSGFWVCHEQNSYCRSIKDVPLYDTNRAGDIIPHVTFDVIGAFKHDLLAMRNIVDVTNFTHGALGHLNRESQITNIVVSERPDAIPELIEISLRLIRRKRYDIVRAVLAQFSQISAVLDTSSQAIYRSLARFSVLDSRVFEKIASKAWRLVVDQFSVHLGGLHLTTLKYHLDWLTYFASSSICDPYICLTECDHGWYSESTFRELVRSCQGGRLLKTAQTEMVLKALLEILLARDSYTEVADLGREVLRELQDRHGQSVAFLAYKAMAEACYRQGKQDEAVDYLKKLVNVSTTAWGWNSPKTIRSMLKLERCLTRQGKSEAARETIEKVPVLSSVDFGWAGF